MLSASHCSIFTILVSIIIGLEIFPCQAGTLPGCEFVNGSMECEEGAVTQGSRKLNALTQFEIVLLIIIGIAALILVAVCNCCPSKSTCDARNRRTWWEDDKRNALYPILSDGICGNNHIKNTAGADTSEETQAEPSDTRFSSSTTVLKGDVENNGKVSKNIKQKPAECMLQLCACV